MKETRFISQNKEKWLESEALLGEERKDPGKLSNLFTQVVDDLSYSRTYYPNRSVRVYLNKVAREYFSIIYNNQKGKKGAFRLFWLDELPQIIIHCKKQLLISLVVFLFSAAIGVFSSAKDQQFTATILGPGYVAMTKDNIKNGDPMAVYKQSHQVDMFLGITLNNLLVAFRTYVFGIFLSIGTLAILLYNGIMVGCFQFFFVQQGLFIQSALSIWLHGTLEISSIIIAGGAGLTLGSGLIFPGTYSRFQAFQISAIRSLKLMLGVTPILVIAAIIESFLTRYTEVPDVVKFILILLSAIFIVGYFIIYPWRKSIKGFEVPITATKLTPANNEPIDVETIKNNAEILKDAFMFYKAVFSKILPRIAGIVFLVTICDLFLGERLRDLREYGDPWANFFGALFYAMKTPKLEFVLINSLTTTWVIFLVTRFINGIAGRTSSKPWLSLPQVILVISPIYFSIFALEGWGILLVCLMFLFILMIAVAQFAESPSNIFSAIARTWTVIGANFGQFVGLHFTLMLLSVSFLMVLSAPLLLMYTTIYKWNFAATDLWSLKVLHFIELYIKSFAFNMILPIMAGSAAYLFFSLIEVSEAGKLKRTISNVAAKYAKPRRS